MALVSKTEAAKLAGITRPTFYRHISKGKVSVVDNKDGTQSVDTAELMRVYGELKPLTDDVDSQKLNTPIHSVIPNNGADGVNVELMEYKIEQLTKQLAESEARNQEERAEKAKLLSVIETQTLAIEHVSNKAGIIDKILNKFKKD
jgi:hypothetical protein